MKKYFIEEAYRRFGLNPEHLGINTEQINQRFFTKEDVDDFLESEQVKIDLNNLDDPISKLFGAINRISFTKADKEWHGM